jgi:hypothetical protein
MIIVLGFVCSAHSIYQDRRLGSRGLSMRPCVQSPLGNQVFIDHQSVCPSDQNPLTTPCRSALHPF